MKKIRIPEIMANTAISIGANIVNLIFSVVNTLIIPEIIGITAYGHYQYFTMLKSFSWLFQFGIVWGFYIKYGGTSYDNLNKRLFSSQFRIYCFFQAVMLFFGIAAISVFVTGNNKKFIFYGFVVCTFVITVKHYLQYILALTNQIKKLSLIMLCEQVVAFSLVMVLVLNSTTDYRIYIISELLTSVLFLAVYIFFVKDIALGKSESIKKGIKELTDNYKTGISLTLIDLLSILSLSLFRIIIDKHWNIETFAQVSLAVSVSTVVTTIVNAVNTALFPYIKNQPKVSQKDSYLFIRSGIDVLCISILFLYPLIITILPYFLPSYKEGMRFLVYFMPLCFLNTKSQLLCGTYFKSLHAQNTYLIIEFSSLLISLILYFVATIIIDSLLAVVVSLLFVVILKAELEDFSISNSLGIAYKSIVLKEIIVTISFVILFNNLPIIHAGLLFILIACSLFHSEFKGVFSKIGIIIKK